MAENNIKERELEEIPKYYESLTDSPIKSVVEGKYNVYDNLLRVIGFRDVNVILPVATVDGGGNTVPSTVTIREVHGVESGIPLVLSNKNTYFDGGLILFREPSITESVFVSTVQSYDTLVEYDITIRFFIFQILTKIV